MTKPAPKNIDDAANDATLEQAAAHLTNGGCVAMPTETVYGLAARIDSPIGIAAIFRLKERPSFDPLIVHVGNLEQVHEVAQEWPETAASLAEKFWPGPLTLVVKRKPNLNPMITAGLGTVGLRMPNHTIALRLIEAVGVPLAAPSANRFGRTSPTSTKHVRAEFPNGITEGEILILEGGDCDVGVESTVCLITSGEAIILRPGGITPEHLRAHFASHATLHHVRVSLALGNQASPGHTEHHYETRKPLIVSWGEELKKDFTYEIEGRRIPAARIHALELPNDPALAARLLYARLREGDQHEGSDALFVRRDLSSTENQDALRTGLWLAVDDRLKRAARLQLGPTTAPR